MIKFQIIRQSESSSSPLEGQVVAHHRSRAIIAPSSHRANTQKENVRGVTFNREILAALDLRYRS